MSENQFQVLPTGKPHVSFSEVKTWKDCSYRHHLTHVKKIDFFKPSPVLDFGTAVHASCEKYLLTREMDVKLCHDALDEAWAKHGSQEEFSEKALKVAKVESEVILSELPAFMDREFPDWVVVDAEHALYESVEGHPHAFKGFIDGVIKCKGKRGEDLYWIIDWKTAGPGGWHPEKKRDVLVQMQLALYKSFLSAKLGLDKKNVRCAFLLLKRGAKPGKTCEAFRVSVGPVTEERAVKVVTDMVRTVAKRMFFKNRLSCKFCPFQDTPHCTAV